MLMPGTTVGIRRSHRTASADPPLRAGVPSARADDDGPAGSLVPVALLLRRPSIWPNDEGPGAGSSR
jgi:hypothetical protein